MFGRFSTGKDKSDGKDVNSLVRAVHGLGTAIQSSGLPSPLDLTKSSGSGKNPSQIPVPTSTLSPNPNQDINLDLDLDLSQNLAAQGVISPENLKILKRFKYRSIRAIRRYLQWVAQGRNFTTNEQAVAFHNGVIERINNLEYNKQRKQEATIQYQQQLDVLINQIDQINKINQSNTSAINLGSANHSSSSSSQCPDFLNEILYGLENFSQTMKVDYAKPIKDESVEQAIERKTKKLIFDRWRLKFTESLIDQLNLDSTKKLIAKLHKHLDMPERHESETEKLFYSMMKMLRSDLKNKSLEAIIFTLKDKLRKIKENPRLSDLVFDACGENFKLQSQIKQNSGEESKQAEQDQQGQDGRLILLKEVIEQAQKTLETRQHQFDIYVARVTEEYQGCQLVMNRYFDDFINLYQSKNSKTPAEVFEMASLAGLKNNDYILPKVHASLVHEVLGDQDIATFVGVSIEAVEGLAIAVGLFSPEYLDRQDMKLVDLAARVIQVVGETSDKLPAKDRQRLLIAIRNMLEGITKAKSLEQTEKSFEESLKESGNEVIGFMKSQLPTNPFGVYQLIRSFTTTSTKQKANSVLENLKKAVESTKSTVGISAEQKTALDTAIEKLNSLVSDGSPALLNYLYASIKAEVSNIPRAGESSQLENILTSVWHAAMIAKSLALIITSSGSLLIQEGIPLVEHLTALIPKPGEKPQPWVKYAKDLRALRNQLINAIALNHKNNSELNLNITNKKQAEFANKIIKYCVALIDSRHTTFNLEYEIFRTMQYALGYCDDEQVKKELVRSVVFILDAKDFHRDEKVRRRTQALEFVLYLLGSSDAVVSTMALDKIDSLQTERKAKSLARFSFVSGKSWGEEHILAIDLKKYKNKSASHLDSSEKKGEDKAAYDYSDDVNIALMDAAAELISGARELSFKYQNIISDKTREYERREKSQEQQLYLGVNGHRDHNNKNPNEWVNIVGQFWHFLENTKSVFVLHGAPTSGKYIMISFLNDLLWRYRRFPSFYPVTVNLADVTTDHLLDEALINEGWKKEEVDSLRKRFSEKTAVSHDENLQDPALPKLLLIIFAVSNDVYPAHFMQRIKERWGREFKCMIVTGAELLSLNDFSNIFSSSLSPQEVQERIQEFFIQPFITQEQVEAVLSHNEATRQLREYQRKESHPQLANVAQQLQQNSSGNAGESFMRDSSEAIYPKAAELWRKHHYQQVFSENRWILNLATTYVMLEMIIKMLPSMFGGKKTLEAISEKQFLDLFIKGMIQVRISAYRKNNQLSISDQELESYALKYSRTAALHMLKHRRLLYRPSLAIELEASSARENMKEDEKLFSDGEDKVAIKYGLKFSPIDACENESQKNQYKFSYKEIWLHFVIEGLYEEVMASAKHHGLSENSILNCSLLHEIPEIFQFFLDYIKTDTVAQGALYQIVLATKKNKNLDRAASNAMSLLVRLRSFANDQQLAGTRFSEADLTGGIFVSANLDGCDMSEAIIDDCDFTHASTNNTKMKKVKLTTPDVHKIGEKIASAVFSYDGRVLAVAGEHGGIACFDCLNNREINIDKALYFSPGFRNCMSEQNEKSNTIVAVADGWLAAWDIATGQAVAGPAFIGDKHGKAFGLLLCENGNVASLHYPDCVLIYYLDNLKQGREINQPDLEILQKNGRKNTFRMSHDGKLLVYFHADVDQYGNDQPKLYIVCTETGEKIYERDCAAENHDFEWLGDSNVLLVQSGEKFLLFDCNNLSDIILNEYIEACEYKYLNKENKIVFYNPAKRQLNTVSFNNIRGIQVSVLPKIIDDSFQKYIYYGQEKIDQIAEIVKLAGEQYVSGIIKNHYFSTDKKYVILFVQDKNKYENKISIFDFEKKTEFKLINISIDNADLFDLCDLDAVNIVKNKLIIYKNWKTAWVRDLHSSSQVRYNLSTDAGIDFAHGYFSFVAKKYNSYGERIEYSVLLDLESLTEIKVIPQTQAKIYFDEIDLLKLCIERESAKQEVSLKISSSQHEVPVAQESDCGLTVRQEKGGKLCILNQYGNPIGARLNNVPDIIATRFIRHDPINHSPSEQRELVVVCKDGTVTYWNFNNSNKQEIEKISHDAEVIASLYTPVYEYTFTLDISGRLLRWSPSKGHKEISAPEDINEMRLCPSGKHLYLFSKANHKLYKYDIADLSSPQQKWKNIRSYFVMQSNGALILLNSSNQLSSEQALIAKDLSDSVNLSSPAKRKIEGLDSAEIYLGVDAGSNANIHRLADAETDAVLYKFSIPDEKVLGIYGYAGTDRFLIYSGHDKTETIKLRVCSDHCFEKFDFECDDQVRAHVSQNMHTALTRDKTGVFLLHQWSSDENKYLASKVSNQILSDVGSIRTTHVAEDRIFVLYSNNSLKVWDLNQQKISQHEIDNVDYFHLCPNSPLFVVRKNMTLQFYRADLHAGKSPSLLKAGIAYKDIHDANGCVWLNKKHLASFHTNHTVMIWRLSDNSCQLLQVFGPRRLSCAGMTGKAMELPADIQKRLVRLGAKLTTVEQDKAQQIKDQHRVFAEMGWLRKEYLSENLDKLGQDGEHGNQVQSQIGQALRQIRHDVVIK